MGNKHIEKSIVFIGFMGAGKTTIGKLLAEKLNRKFIDVDEEIEKECKMPVSQIFAIFGEKTFREKEKSIITNLCEQKGKILSLGGGAFLQKEIREICLSRSIVIFLDISFESWRDRLELIIDTRPVLHGKTLEEMEELYYSRQAVYSQHHIKIETDHKSPAEIAAKIMEEIE